MKHGGYRDMMGRLARDMLLLAGFAAVLWGCWQWSPNVACIVGGLGAMGGTVIWYIAARGPTNGHR